MEYYFGQQQELNYIRDTAMRVACEGLTLEELERLSPELLRATPALYEALENLVFYASNNGVPWSYLKQAISKGKEALAQVKGE